MKPGPKPDPREIAFDALVDIAERERFAHMAIPAVLGKSTLDRRDRALVTEMAYGVIRRRLSLEWLVSQFSGRKISKIDPAAVSLLRLGLYQLLYMDKIPDHAAVNTSVNMAKSRLKPGADKFVNAILRRAIREREQLPWPDRQNDEANFLSVYYSHPRWIVELWLAELGLKATEALLAADNERPNVTLRTNTLKISRDALLERFKSEELAVRAGRFCPEAIIVDDQVPDDYFESGLVYAQDEGSLLVGHIVNPIAGETIVDIGAGPGGKTTHLAQLMGDSGRIIAIDVKQSRLGRVSENCRRLDIHCVQTLLADGAQLRPTSARGSRQTRDHIPMADKVLIDAPCSGLGVLARRPDARWRKSFEKISELAGLQQEILTAGAGLVRPGGDLIYSVCTITRAETTAVIEAFLKEHKEFTAVPFESNGLSAPNGTLQLLPHIDGTDGMFIVKLRRS